MNEPTPVAAPEPKRGKFRPVVIWPDARLAQPCESYEVVTDEVRALLDDMVATMDHCNGSGLAAPQVGVNRRAIVLRVRKVADPAKPEAVEHEIVYLVNPEPTFASEETQTGAEGCLSFPGLHFPSRRPKVVRVKALGYDGAPFEIGGDGLLAVALMHEIDHLNGVLIIDALSNLKRDVLRRKLTKLKARGLRYRSPEEIAEARK